MGTFREHGGDEGARRPPRVITLPPSAFATEWRERPTEPVELGLRYLPDGETETARTEAAKHAMRLHPDDLELANDCFNDALLRWIVSRCTCSAEDAREPYFRAAQDTVWFALSEDGVKLIAHEYEVFKIETSPLHPPATDEEILDLAALLEDEPPFAGMSTAEERGTRRLIGVVLERIGAARVRVAEADETSEPAAAE